MKLVHSTTLKKAHCALNYGVTWSLKASWILPRFKIYFTMSCKLIVIMFQKTNETLCVPCHHTTINRLEINGSCNETIGKNKLKNTLNITWHDDGDVYHLNFSFTQVCIVYVAFIMSTILLLHFYFLQWTIHEHIYSCVDSSKDYFMNY